MNKKILLLPALFFLSLTAVFALGGREREQPAPIVQVTGIVRFVGNANFPEIVISGEYEWYIAKEEMNKLHHLQHRTVTVKGKETVQELKFANGMPAGQRRELRNIKIIEVQQ